MKTIIISNQPDITRAAEAAGVSRIMVDLESIGKKERQASRNTFISSHVPQDIARVRGVLTKAELIVRINPWYARSRDEIDHAVNTGAQIIMLPMITDMEQLEAAADVLAGRAKLLPLVETKYSMEHIAEIAAHPQVPEVYIGLNDLHLSLGLAFLFEPLALGYVDTMAAHIKAAGKPFGFGGIATMGSGELPAEHILGEHLRLGSQCVILSSRFCRDIEMEKAEGREQRLSGALQRMQEAEARLHQRSAAQTEQDRLETFALIRRLAQKP